MVLQLDAGIGAAVLDSNSYVEIRERNNYISLALDIYHNINAYWKEENTKKLTPVINLLALCYQENLL
jgi:hypothetical protein